jgi:hypothetical protein
MLYVDTLRPLAGRVGEANAGQGGTPAGLPGNPAQPARVGPD